MRLAGVALARDDHPGKGAGLDGIEPALAEDRFDPLLNCGDCQGGGLTHHVPFWLRMTLLRAVEVLHT
ncbi:hypothetical protein D3C72_2311410 [compost metagenome]